MYADFADFMRKKLPYVGPKGLSERAFERLLKYKRGKFQNVMRGVVGPNLKDIGRMAEILSLSPKDAILFRELALRANEYHDLADEFVDLHARVAKSEKRLDQLEKLLGEQGR